MYGIILSLYEFFMGLTRPDASGMLKVVALKAFFHEGFMSFILRKENSKDGTSISAQNTRRPLTKAVRFGVRWFLRRSSGVVLLVLIILGLGAGSSLSLNGQGFLFAQDASSSGGSYVEEVYVDALSNAPQITSPFIAQGQSFAPDYGVLDYQDDQDSTYVDNFLTGYLSPTNFPSIGGTNRRAIVQHTVRDGETLSFIAASYGVSVDTIKWANKIANPDALSPGTVLDILPVSGVAHVVRQGDSIEKIAATYKGDIASIIAFNALPADGRLKNGEVIIVPDGSLPAPPRPLTPAGKTAPRFTQNIQTAGYFIAPTTGRNFGIQHAHNGDDIANSCGTPIYAAADGTVTKVFLTDDRTRRAGGGYGNHVLIKHDNGTETLYGHLLKGTILAAVGEVVGKGQQIASMGGKPGLPGAGRSTGCHLHFEVHGGANPFVRIFNHRHDQ